MQKMRVGYFLCSMLSVVLTGNVYGAKTGLEEPHQSINPNVEEYVWAEEGTTLPDYPDAENLLEVIVDLPGSKFRYFIDTKSLGYSKADGIVRYTLVIRSKTGANNVAFEGMRCTTKEYKIYAFGDGKGTFRAMREPQWKPIVDTLYTRYRKDLWEFYLCAHKMLDRTPEKMINAIKYGKYERSDRGFQ